jgi:sulfate transport system substrate-binding protein
MAKHPLTSTLSRRPFLQLAVSIALAELGTGTTLHAQTLLPVTLLNVSYDPTREPYVEYNAAFT